MVSKAVERAQRTVEDRNFEIRKNVLKYDEVMNEQRKVIYKRRQQVLDGEDLREAAIEAIERAIGRQVDLHCEGEFAENWDVEELLVAVKTYFPTRVTKEQLDDAGVGRRSRTDAVRRCGRRCTRPRKSTSATRRCATSSAASCSRCSTSTGASTSTRWTTCRRASTCGRWASATRSPSGSAKASTCSKR